MTGKVSLEKRDIQDFWFFFDIGNDYLYNVWKFISFAITQSKWLSLYYWPHMGLWTLISSWKQFWFGSLKTTLKTLINLVNFSILNSLSKHFKNLCHLKSEQKDKVLKMFSKPNKNLTEVLIHWLNEEPKLFAFKKQQNVTLNHFQHLSQTILQTEKSGLG